MVVGVPPPATHTHTHTHTHFSHLTRGWKAVASRVPVGLERFSSWFRKVFFFFIHSWILSLVGREFWGGEGEFACKSPGPGGG